MNTLIIESNIELKENRGRKTGKSKEYFIGNELYSTLKYNESVFFDLDENLNMKNIMIRLKRLNDKNVTNYLYRSNLDIKEVLINNHIENIEGFRIYRVQ